MTPRKDDLWRPGDYDDEPRSNGNFGLNVQQQEANKATKKSETLEQMADRLTAQMISNLNQAAKEAAERKTKVEQIADKLAEETMNAFRQAAAEAEERKRAGKYLLPPLRCRNRIAEL